MMSNAVSSGMMKIMRQQSRHLPAFILLELLSAPQHGGALQTSLNGRMPGLNADSGAVYRALNKLEKDGEVTSEWDTSERGPAKHVYQITAKGTESLKEWEKDIARRRGFLDLFLTEYHRLIEKKTKRSMHNG